MPIANDTMFKRYISLIFIFFSALLGYAQNAADSLTVNSGQEHCHIPISSSGKGANCRHSSSDGYSFGLKTNMLYDAGLIPNIGVEFPIGKHFSIGGNWMYAWWKNHGRNRHWRIYGGDINARYWLKEGARSLSGHHVGLYATVLLYQVGFGNKGYISGIPGENMTGGKPWIGAGFDYGYSMKVNSRLNIDFSLGVGYAGGEQRNYRLIGDCYVWQSSHRKHWWGPTKAEIALVWKIGKSPDSRKGFAQ